MTHVSFSVAQPNHRYQERSITKLSCWYHAYLTRAGRIKVSNNTMVKDRRIEEQQVVDLAGVQFWYDFILKLLFQCFVPAWLAAANENYSVLRFVFCQDLEVTNVSMSSATELTCIHVIEPCLLFYILAPIRGLMSNNRLMTRRPKSIIKQTKAIQYKVDHRLMLTNQK